MKFINLFIMLILILVFVTACNKQAAVKKDISKDTTQTEKTSETQESPKGVAGEVTPAQSSQITNVGISDQELADLEKELNEEFIEDVEEIGFE